MFVLQRLLLYGCLGAMCCVLVMIYFECVFMNLYFVVFGYYNICSSQKLQFINQALCVTCGCCLN